MNSFHNPPIFGHVTIFVNNHSKLDCGHISLNGNTSAAKQDCNNPKTLPWSYSFLYLLHYQYV